jgi:hypothetical protein
MDAQLKAKWVKALRSGKYRQGKQVLLNEDGEERSYCCLGVLCAVAFKELDAGSYTWLNRVTRDYSPFVRMNDDEDKTFPEIADYIERNL